MEQHKSNLKNKCRVCARSTGTRNHNKLEEPSRSVLAKVYGIVVEKEPDEIFPPALCNSCFLTLRRANLEGDTGPILNIHSWSAHNSSECSVCTPASAGRPRKRKMGRPSIDESILRNIVRKINAVKAPEFAPFPLHKSLFLPSLFLDHVLCQVCQCIPSQAIEISTCRHYLCAECIINSTSFSCPCNRHTLNPNDLCAPSQLSLEVMGSLLLHCSERCDQILQLQHLKTHLQSSCEQTMIPQLAAISVEHILSKDLYQSPSLMKIHTMGLLTEKLFPTSGPVTCRSSTGKVFNKNNVTSSS